MIRFWIIFSIIIPISFYPYSSSHQLKILKSHGSWLPSHELQATAGTAALCLAAIHLSPRLLPSIPPSLAGVIFASLIALVFKFPVQTLQDVAGKSVFSGGWNSLPKIVDFSKFTVPMNKDTLLAVVPVALGIAGIATLETLLALKLTSKQFKQKDVDPDRTSVGLGLGTAASALFGGFGGCGLIPNTLLNGKSGGCTRISTLSYALSLAMFVVIFAPILGRLPVAALGGLMVSIAFNTFEWKESYDVLTSSYHSYHGIIDLIALLATMGLCYKVDMGVGVFAGVVICQGGNFLLNFVKKSS